MMEQGPKDYTVPPRPLFYIMKAYSRIDQHLTVKELEKEVYTYRSIRDRVLSIGRKYK